MFKRNWLNWSAYVVLAVGVLCLLITIVGAAGNRTGLLHFRVASGLFLSVGKAALPIAGVALLVLIMTNLKRAPRAAKVSAAIGLVLAVGLYVPYYIFADRAQTLPRIHDITTGSQNHYGKK